ncbi:MAG: sigma-70 family RNA polymerase sigma factor [Motiliproteus sp.]
MHSDLWNSQVESCLAQVQLRHQPAFEELYQLTNGKLYALTLRIIPDRELAADVLQESYLKLWRNAANYRSGLGGAWAWICQLTRNCAIDRARQMLRRPESPEDPLLSQLVGDDSGLWQLNHDLSRCLRTIREEPRSAIIYAYLHGLTHSELAERLQTPLGTLKSWIRRGLKELNQCLEA